MLLEAAGFGVGTLGGSGLKLAGKALDGLMADKLAARETARHKHDEAMADKNAARKFAVDMGSAGAWARRFIVITVFSYLFIFPLVIVLLNHTVNYVYVEEGGGLLAWLFGMGKGTKVITMTGFVVLPFQRLLASTVAGFYFGAGIVK